MSFFLLDMTKDHNFAFHFHDNDLLVAMAIYYYMLDPHPHYDKST